MIQFEDPIVFNLEKRSGNLAVSYSNVMEIGQGGPAIGYLALNGKRIEGYRFGGPCLIAGDFVYTPVYVKKLLGSGFKLSKIHTGTLEVSVSGKTKDLIYLDRIEGEKIFFYEDLNKAILHWLKM